jgi:hypothetical protein
MYLNECAAEEKRETAAMTLVIANTSPFARKGPIHG